MVDRNKQMQTLAIVAQALAGMITAEEMIEALESLLEVKFERAVNGK